MEEESTYADRITEKSPVEDSQAERDMHGADGRWLRRGAVEHLEMLDSDRTACYSGKVSMVPGEVPVVRQERKEVVTRVLLVFSIYWRGRFFISWRVILS